MYLPPIATTDPPATSSFPCPYSFTFLETLMDATRWHINPCSDHEERHLQGEDDDAGLRLIESLFAASC
ncbi:hypothetical protein GYH30_050137 [Glycine max]|nr:hypothetical protein GYH30_050137 [Glycine max]